MGCTQSAAAVVAVDKESASTTLSVIKKLHHLPVSSDTKICTNLYINDNGPHAPDSSKSMNTAITTATNSTVNASNTTTNSTANSRNTIPRITTTLSYQIADADAYDNDDDSDDDFEVTTECDDESIHSMLLHSGRSTASYMFFPNDTDRRPLHEKFTMIDEMSTDDNNDHHNKYSKSCEDIANMDDPPIPCTILTIRRKKAKSPQNAENNIVDEAATRYNAVSEPIEEYHRLLSVHQEQQKKLLSLMTNLLPWTHAIVMRKQRQVQVRQTMITSLLWFSMLIWPNMHFQKHTNNASHRTCHMSSNISRPRNPFTLFRR
jgi:hypothetical protein